MRRLEIRAERLRSTRKAREQRLAELDREIAHREGQVETAGGEGLGEELARLRDEAALWGRLAQNHDRRVRTLQMLRDEIATCYDEQRDRLHAPIKRHLKPYLEDVFSARTPSSVKAMRLTASAGALRWSASSSCPTAPRSKSPS